MKDMIYREDAIEVVMKHKISFTVQQDVAREIDALPSAEAVKVAYICDGRKCDSDCSECFRTLDIEHAKDFKLMGDTYFQQEAEAEPTVIRSRTFMPKKDFKEWAKRIRETNPNAVVIPCDAEFTSAEAVQIHNDGTLEVKVPNAQKVGRVLVMDTDSHIGGGLFYPDEAVQGEWVQMMADGSDGSHWYEYECSHCGEVVLRPYNYCPNCGCVMDKRGGK